MRLKNTSTVKFKRKEDIYFMKNKFKLIHIPITGVLAAMSAILYVFPKIRWIPPFHFLEIDFADVPALIASCLINPIVGGTVVLIRNTIHLLISSTGMVGELSNFIISGTYVVFAGIVFKVLKKKQSELSLMRLSVAMLLSTAVQIIAAVLCNRYIMIPMYGIQGDPADYILAAVVPFNLIKTLISSIIFITIYKALIPKIRRYI